MARLTNKVAIVTGAASGMGLAQARRFLQEGAKVILADIDRRGDVLAQALGAAALYVHLDVASELSWEDAVGVAEARFGGVDILVNSAGVCHLLTLNETSLEQFEQQIRSIKSGFSWACGRFFSRCGGVAGVLSSTSLPEPDCGVFPGRQDMPRRNGRCVE